MSSETPPNETPPTETPATETPGRKRLTFVFLVVLVSDVFLVAGSWAFIQSLADHQFRGGLGRWLGSVLAVGVTLSALWGTVGVGKLLLRSFATPSDERS